MSHDPRITSRRNALKCMAFGSAGTLFKKISYGIALPGLVIGVGIYQHVAAKLIFVRVLRDSRHLQANTVTHWATWLGSNLILGVCSTPMAGPGKSTN